MSTIAWRLCWRIREAEAGRRRVAELTRLIMQDADEESLEDLLTELAGARSEPNSPPAQAVEFGGAQDRLT